MTRIRSWNAKLNVNILQLVCIPLRLRIAMQTTAFPNVPKINIIEYASRKIHVIYVDWTLHSRSDVVVLFILFVSALGEMRWSRISVGRQTTGFELKQLSLMFLQPPLFYSNNSTSMLSESRGKTNYKSSRC